MSNLKTIITQVNFGGFIDNVIFDKNNINVKDDSSCVSVFIKTKDVFFKEEKVAFQKISLLKSALTLLNSFKFEEKEDGLYFESETGSEFYFPKSDFEIIPKPRMSIETFLEEYSEDKVEMILTSSMIEEIKNAIQFGFNENATFFTDKGNLRFSVGDNNSSMYKTSSLLNTKKKINNVYEKRFISGLLEILPEGTKMIIDFKDGESLPLIFTYKIDGDCYYHVIVPVEVSYNSNSNEENKNNKGEEF
jgi:hypothetical protein